MSKEEQRKRKATGKLNLKSGSKIFNKSNH
jgi:hypothetical protein